MSNTIFHVTVAALVGAMAVAGVAIAMAPSTAVDPRLDGCVLNFLGRLPKVEGARVANIKSEYSHTSDPWKNQPHPPGSQLLEIWDIVVTVNFNGRPVYYPHQCIIRVNRTAEPTKSR